MKPTIAQQSSYANTHLIVTKNALNFQLEDC